jgi:RNA polymerase sigma factor for flagellar operon FliA
VSVAHRSISRYAAGGVAASSREDLIQTHARLLDRHARAVAARTGHDPEEFWSVGAMALIEAAARYDPTQGATLETYLGHRVRGAMLDEVRRLDRLPRRLRRRVKEVGDAHTRLSGEGQAVDVEELAAAVGCTPEETTLALQLAAPVLDSDGVSLVDDEPSIEALLVAEERIADLESAVQALPERLRMIVALRYVEDLSQRDIARILGVSEARVSQLLKAAIGRLRQSLADPAALQEL